MLGFSAALWNKKQHQLNIDAPKVLKGKDYLFHFFSNDKFNEDKLFVKLNEYIIVLDGVILNKNKLLKEYASNSWAELILQLYQKFETKFPQLLRGEFNGAVYNTLDKTLYAFTNQGATKPVFWLAHDNCIACSSSYYQLADWMKEWKIQPELDETGVYCQLSYGYFIEEYTYLKNIKKLKAGNYLLYKGGKVEVDHYQTYNALPKHGLNDKETIAGLNEHFLNAVQMEYEKDLEYNYKHLSTLSGGLDSRANMILAHKLGFKDNYAITCSQSNYQDESISRQIAEDYNWKHFFLPLDNAAHLMEPQKQVDYSEGTVFFAGAAQHRILMEKTDTNGYGLLHSGQLGKLGGFVLNPFQEKPDVSKKAISNKLIPKAAEKLRHIEDRYNSLEVMLLYNRTFNHTNTGYFVSEDFTYMVSPFYDVDFLEFSIAMHESQKTKERIYIDWWKQLHPEILNYRWAGLNLKPNAHWKMKYGKYINLVRNGFQRKILKQEHKYQMTPEDYWYKQYVELRKVSETLFDQYINILSPWPEIKTDATDLFKNGNYAEKSEVLTVLLTLNRIL